MSNNSREASPEAIEARAAAWLAQRDGGFVPGEAEEFQRWLRADPRHEAAMRRLESAWETLLELRDFRPEARRHPDRDLLAARPSHPSRWLPAAAMAIGAALAAMILLHPAAPTAPASPAEQHYATADGGYERVALPDGSVVELNSNTEVNVLYTPAERRLWLLGGEAHFTVAKNKQRPFLVQAGNVSLRAVGTAFDVLLRDRAVEVLVTEGRVQVTRGGAPVEFKAPSGGTGALAFRERAVIPLAPAEDVRVETVATGAVDRFLAWQAPRLSFGDATLGEAVAQFNQRNRIKLVIGTPELANIPIGGSFQADNVEGFVRLLTGSGEIVATRPDAYHIVLSSAK